MESLKEIKKICLFGLDNVAANLVTAFREAGFKGRVFAVGEPDAIRQAWEFGIINDGSSEIEEGLQDTQLVILSALREELHERFATILKEADPGSIIIDQAHSKGYVDAVFETTGRDDVHYVGIRLIDAPELAEHLSRPQARFFENCSLILTPRVKEDLDSYALLSSALESVGAQVIALSPVAHDKLIADYVHLPRTVMLAILEQVYAQNEGDCLRPDILGDQLVEQIREMRDLSQTSWLEDLESAGAPLIEGIDLLVERLQTMKADLLSRKMRHRCDRLLTAASLSLKQADEAEQPRLMFLSNDQAKILEQVSQLLADAHLRISNLERTRRTGSEAFKLTMNSALDRDNAVNLLKTAGIDAFDI